VRPSERGGDKRDQEVRRGTGTGRRWRRGEEEGKEHVAPCGAVGGVCDDGLPLRGHQTENLLVRFQVRGLQTPRFGLVPCRAGKKARGSRAGSGSIRLGSAR
jgi:hypothetical protein